MTITRKSHIKRIYKDDDPASDKWIDIERLDELTYESGSAYQYRKKVWKFKWDDFNPDDTKTVTKKKITDPNDEANFIEVPVRKLVFVKEASGRQYQGNKYRFLNDGSNRTRETHSRRIYHHDIPDEHLNEGKPPSDPNDYLEALGDQDMDRYVDVEVIDKYRSKENEARDAQGNLKKKSTWQGKKWAPTKNDPLLQEPMKDTDEADPDFVPTINPDDGPKVDPPWRLDPLQNIVNVQWGVTGAVFVAAGDAEMILRAEIKKGDIEKRKDMSDEQKKANPVFELIPIPSDFAGEGQYAGARGGSYRKVVTDEDKEQFGEDAEPHGMFVLAGNDVSLEEHHSWGIIMSSPDGETWTLAGKLETLSPIGDDAGFNAMVWDEGFHAHGFTHEFYHEETESPDSPGPIQVDYYNVMFSGEDGTSFSESSKEHIYNSEAIGGEPPPLPDPDKKPAAFEEHCANNPAQLPDGYFGYYEKKNSEGEIIESFLAVPESPPHYWQDHTDPSKTVNITILKDGETIEKSSEAPFYVNGVAYVSGILVVGGTDKGDPAKAMLACSTDQGDTWETVWEAEEDFMREIWVVLGAPRSDIVKETNGGEVPA